MSHIFFFYISDGKLSLLQCKRNTNEFDLSADPSIDWIFSIAPRKQCGKKNYFYQQVGTFRNFKQFPNHRRKLHEKCHPFHSSFAGKSARFSLQNWSLKSNFAVFKIIHFKMEPFSLWNGCLTVHGACCTLSIEAYRNAKQFVLNFPKNCLICVF